MSIMSNLTTNTTQLEALLAKVNALPEAGSEDLDNELTTQENLILQLSTILDSKASGGSSGGSIETVTGTIVNETLPHLEGTLCYLDENLSLQTSSIGEHVPYMFKPVKNSMFSIYTSQVYIDCSGATLVTSGGGVRVFIANEDGFVIAYDM